MKVELLAGMFQPPQHKGSPPHCSRDSPAGAHEEKERSNIEKLGLCGLSSLMKRCITPEAQYVYYTLLNEKVAGVVTYG